MSEPGNNREFFFLKVGKKALHVLINALFCTFVSMQLLFRLRGEGLNDKVGEGGGPLALSNGISVVC